MNEQKLIDIMFQIALTISGSPEHFRDKTNTQIAEWVTKQLRDNGFDTEPSGMSWGILKRSQL